MNGADEILPLTEFFLNRYGRRYGRPLNPLSDVVRQRLMSYEWPGNVRELEQLIKRFVVLQDESLVLQDSCRFRGAALRWLEGSTPDILPTRNFQ